MSKILCVAFVGQGNELLALQSFRPKYVDDKESLSDVNEHFVMYAALDAVDEKIRNAVSRSSSSGRQPALPNYLGFLANVDEFQVYGYMTRTKIKILVAVEITLHPQREVENICKQLHGAYVSWVSNPFALLPTASDDAASSKGAVSISNSKSFDTSIREIVRAFNEMGHC